MAQEIRPGISELIGRECVCEMADGFPRSEIRRVVVEAISLPMIKIRRTDAGANSYWINVSLIASIQAV